MTGSSGSSGGGSGLFSWFGWGVDLAKGIASAGLNTGVSATSTAISGLITKFLEKTSADAVLCALEKKPEFHTFLEGILPYIYIQICLRYIFPMLIIIIVPIVFVCWLWRAESAEKYNEFINSIFDAATDYVVRGCKACGRGIVCGCGYLRKLIGGGVSIKVEPEDLSNLRNSVEQLSQDVYNTIEEIEEPVSMLFPTR